MILVFAIIIIVIMCLLIHFNKYEQGQKEKPESKYKVVHSTMVTYTDDSFTQMFFLENEFGDRKTAGKIPYEYSGIVNMWLSGDIDTKELKCLNKDTGSSDKMKEEKEDKLVEAINSVIEQAIYHGGDTGGPYLTNIKELMNSLLKLIDTLEGEFAVIMINDIPQIRRIY